MSRAYMIVATIALFLQHCGGFPWASKFMKDKADYVHISLHTESDRPKRSVGMPEHMHFDFRFAHETLEVRLKRSVAMKDSKDGARSNFPFFVIDNGTLSRQQLPFQQMAAVYENDTMRQVFVVRPKPQPSTDYFLEGVFYDDEQNQYHVIPDGNGYHWIHKQVSIVDFQGDYIDNNGPPTADKRSATWSRKRRHSRLFALSSHLTSALLEPIMDHGQPSARSRGKRQSDSHYEIELFMVADFKDYSEWLRYYNSNKTKTVMEMYTYYSFVAAWISQRYRGIRNVDPDLRIDIITTGLLVANTSSDSRWTEDNVHVLDVDGKMYAEATLSLDSFRHWIDKRTVRLPDSDHWMLFTGYNIYTLTEQGKDRHVAGLSKLGGLCTFNSVSIIEQDNTASVGAKAAHELGHSLSARHDGDVKDCRDEDNYIMSRKLKTPDVENLASRPWQFSSCSVRAFRQFLSRIKCAHILKATSNLLTSESAPELEEGQLFSADAQCRLALGEGSYFSRAIYQHPSSLYSYQAMCRLLFCAVPGFPSIFRAIFAMEKTTCGDRKWCQQGRCTADERAPRSSDSCPQGDSSNVRCQLDGCAHYSPYSKSICCKTCQEQAPAHNFIYSLANAAIQMDTITHRLPPIASLQHLPPAVKTTSTASSIVPISTTAAVLSTVTTDTDVTKTWHTVLPTAVSSTTEALTTTTLRNENFSVKTKPTMTSHPEVRTTLLQMINISATAATAGMHSNPLVAITSPQTAALIQATPNFSSSQSLVNEYVMATVLTSNNTVIATTSIAADQVHSTTQPMSSLSAVIVSHSPYVAPGTSTRTAEHAYLQLPGNLTDLERSQNLDSTNSAFVAPQSGLNLTKSLDLLNTTVHNHSQEPLAEAKEKKPNNQYENNLAFVKTQKHLISSQTKHFLDGAPEHKAVPHISLGGAPELNADSHISLGGVPELKADPRISLGGAPEHKADPHISLGGAPELNADSHISLGGVPELKADPRISLGGAPEHKADPHISLGGAPELKAVPHISLGGAPELKAVPHISLWGTPELNADSHVSLGGTLERKTVPYISLGGAPELKTYPHISVGEAPKLKADPYISLGGAPEFNADPHISLGGASELNANPMGGLKEDLMPARTQSGLERAVEHIAGPIPMLNRFSSQEQTTLAERQSVTTVISSGPEVTVNNETSTVSEGGRSDSLRTSVMLPAVSSTVPPATTTLNQKQKSIPQVHVETSSFSDLAPPSAQNNKLTNIMTIESTTHPSISSGSPDFVSNQTVIASTASSSQNVLISSSDTPDFVSNQTVIASTASSSQNVLISSSDKSDFVSNQTVIASTASISQNVLISSSELSISTSTAAQVTILTDSARTEMELNPLHIDQVLQPEVVTEATLSTENLPTYLSLVHSANSHLALDTGQAKISQLKVVQPIYQKSGVHLPSHDLPSHDLPVHVTPANMPVHVTPANMPVHVTPANMPVHVTPANMPVHVTPANMPVHVTPANMPVHVTPANMPVHVTPANMPVHVTPANMPVHVTPANMPVHVTPANMPVHVTPADMPEQVTSADMPVHVTPANMPVHVTPANMPVHVTPANMPVHVTPANMPVHVTPANMPVHVTPADMPVHVTPADMPVQVTSADLPVHGTPADLPIHGTPADLPVHGTPADLPVHVTSTDMPVHVTSANMPVHVTPANMPVHVTPADMPVHVTPANMPVHVTPADMPVHVTPADMPVQVTSADLHVHGTPADLPVHGTPGSHALPGIKHVPSHLPAHVNQAPLSINHLHKSAESHQMFPSPSHLMFPSLSHHDGPGLARNKGLHSRAGIGAMEPEPSEMVKNQSTNGTRDITISRHSTQPHPVEMVKNQTTSGPPDLTISRHSTQLHPAEMVKNHTTSGPADITISGHFIQPHPAEMVKNQTTSGPPDLTISGHSAQPESATRQITAPLSSTLSSESSLRLSSDEVPSYFLFRSSSLLTDTKPALTAFSHDHNVTMRLQALNRLHNSLRESFSTVPRSMNTTPPSDAVSAIQEQEPVAGLSTAANEHQRCLTLCQLFREPQRCLTLCQLFREPQRCLTLCQLFREPQRCLTLCQLFREPQRCLTLCQLFREPQRCLTLCQLFREPQRCLTLCQLFREPQRCLTLCQLFREPTLNSGNAYLDGRSRFFHSRMETAFDRLRNGS